MLRLSMSSPFDLYEADETQNTTRTTHRGRQYPLTRSLSEEEEMVIRKLVGSDGLERIEAIARLMPSGHSYRDFPHLLTCHLLSLGIELAEKVVRQTLGIEENTH